MPNDALQALRDLFNKQARRFDSSKNFPGTELPNVEPASIFRESSEIVGGQDFSNSVEGLFQKVPEARGRSPRIVHGPTQGTMETIGLFNDLRSERSDLGLPMYELQDYPRLNLLGIKGDDADRIPNEISINPRLRPSKFGDEGHSIEPTLGHELGHTIDMEHGPALEALESLVYDAYGLPRKTPLSRFPK